jgi:hypothetical protein
MIQSSNGEDREGNKRYSIETNVDNFVFIDGKREEVKEDEKFASGFRIEVNDFDLKPLLSQEK